ncbi:MAG: type III-B CRISPR module-associated protein Cmr3 [Nitrospira sp.]|nr:type III-B CRISPR module-associated protein Cmr3 [Nitrospira sp.]
MVTTTTRQTLFIEPLDVLVLRGNKLFGDPGSFGESLVPPWPSVAAGAIRSALLAHKKVDLQAFAKGQVPDTELGTPQQPGPFRLMNFRLARRSSGSSDGQVEPLFAPPADLVIRREDGDALECVRLQPTELPAGIHSSATTKLHAVLPERERSKPVSGYWLTHEGWQAYLLGHDLNAKNQLVRTSDLWRLDTRVGVGLDATKRSAAEGKLFTVQAVAMRQRHHGNGHDYDVGFLAEVEGATIPRELILRFGGDGRAARAHLVSHVPSEPDPSELDLINQIVNARRCRLILTSPGIFPGGWLPTGATPTGTGEIRFQLHGVRARLVCAAVPRAEVVSGWDLAKWQPKPAQRVAPTGSVYWLDQIEATAEQLRDLAAEGLWTHPPDDPARRAEGFNRFTWGLWS